MSKSKISVSQIRRLIAEEKTNQMNDDARKEYLRQMDILKQMKSNSQIAKSSKEYLDQVEITKKAAKKAGIDLKYLKEGDIKLLSLSGPEDQLEPETQEVPDIEIGHEDNEPHMVRRQVYDIAVYASKLHKKLKEMEMSGQEIDFPSWWQSKVTIAREHISKAQHYLEFGEKEDIINQLALENKKVKDVKSLKEDIVNLAKSKKIKK